MTARAGLARIAPGVGIGVVFLYTLHDRFELVENRVLVLIGVIVAVAGLLIRWRNARTGDVVSPDTSALRRRTVVAFGLLGAISMALALIRTLVLSRGALRDDLVAALVPPLLGWSVFLLLPVGLAPAAPHGAAPDPRPWFPRVWLVAAGAFVAIWIATLVRALFRTPSELRGLFSCSCRIRRCRSRCSSACHGSTLAASPGAPWSPAISARRMRGSPAGFPATARCVPKRRRRHAKRVSYRTPRASTRPRGAIILDSSPHLERNELPC